MRTPPSWLSLFPKAPHLNTITSEVGFQYALWLLRVLNKHLTDPRLKSIKAVESLNSYSLWLQWDPYKVGVRSEGGEPLNGVMMKRLQHKAGKLSVTSKCLSTFQHLVEIESLGSIMWKKRTEPDIFVWQVFCYHMLCPSRKVSIWTL